MHQVIQMKCGKFLLGAILKSLLQDLGLLATTADRSLERSLFYTYNSHN
jgi:hypothetical protein